MVKKQAVVLLVMLTSFISFSKETYKAMFYNVLNFSLQEPANRITIYNILGQKMEEIHIQLRNLIELNVSYLYSGMYYIATNNKNIEPLKFIKR